jgi:hypothetical protein
LIAFDVTSEVKAEWLKKPFKLIAAQSGGDE